MYKTDTDKYYILVTAEGNEMVTSIYTNAQTPPVLGVGPVTSADGNINRTCYANPDYFYTTWTEVLEGQCKDQNDISYDSLKKGTTSDISTLQDCINDCSAVPACIGFSIEDVNTIECNLQVTNNEIALLPAILPDYDVENDT